MHAIFYDLETTDSSFLGQIVNFSFIHVDDNFKIIDELSADVRISRLQLPAPMAILTNRVNVIEHQQRAKLNEVRALTSITKFIRAALDRSKAKIPLIGYNSSRFDLPFLRTSLIRNGINPYFEGKIAYADLLHAVRKLSASDAKFPRPKSKDDKNKLSLRLESITSAFSLLEGEQTHTSRDDVLLTIELAKHLYEKFNLDIRTTAMYEGSHLDSTARKGNAFYQLSPNYDLREKEIAISTPITLLDADYRYALWINLDRYEEEQGRGSISWYNKSNSLLALQAERKASAKHIKLAKQALEEFAQLNLGNFFETSTCDIEQDIYRIDFDSIEALRQAIFEKKLDALKNGSCRDARTAYRRYELANYKWGSGDDERIKRMLREYALYRYGGKAQMHKSIDPDQESRAGQYHATLASYLSELEALRNAGSAADKTLLDALKQFYQSSELLELAGQELLKAAPQPPLAAAPDSSASA